MHLDIRSSIDTDVIDYTFQILPNPTSEIITLIYSRWCGKFKTPTIRDAKEVWWKVVETQDN